MVNALPGDKIFSLSKLRAFADDIFNVSQTEQFFFHGVEKTWTKNENVGSTLSPFPTMFSNGFFHMVDKVGFAQLRIKTFFGSRIRLFIKTLWQKDELISNSSSPNLNIF